MRYQKPRKPRGLKLSGEKSYDLCPHCYAPHCDSFFRNRNVEDRLKKGLCPACGQPTGHCKCKSKLGIQNPIIKTHNNK